MLLHGFRNCLIPFLISSFILKLKSEIIHPSAQAEDSIGSKDFAQFSSSNTIGGDLPRENNEDLKGFVPATFGDISTSGGVINVPQDSEEDEEVEQECPEDQWWHIRGRRCVPLVCVGGNKYRNMDTGECLIRRNFDFGYRNMGGGRSFGRYNPRTLLKNSKGRLRFALPTKVKG